MIITILVNLADYSGDFSEPIMVLRKRRKYFRHFCFPSAQVTCGSRFNLEGLMFHLLSFNIYNKSLCNQEGGALSREATSISTTLRF